MTGAANGWPEPRAGRPASTVEGRAPAAQTAVQMKEEKAMYSNILVPIALEEGESVTAPMKVARALASEGARITLLHAFESPPAYALHYVPADLLKATRDGIQAELDSLAKDLPNGRAVVVEGHPGRSIADWAAENDADLIVMASHRPGMGDVFWGSTAAHVVRHVGCAVHVLR